MKFIVVSGIDGSGKTTVIKGLRERLVRKGVKTHYKWMRYNHILCKPVHGLCRIIGLSKSYNTKLGKVWRHEFYRSRNFCKIYFLLTYIDTWIGKVKLLQQLKNRKVDLIICDRWILDIVIDLAVKSRNINLLNSRICSLFFGLYPKNLTQYIVIRNFNDVLNCRIENQEDPDFLLKFNCYQKMSQLKDCIKIYNNSSIEKTVEQFIKYNR